MKAGTQANRHYFTLDGKVIHGRFLSTNLGISHTHLYFVSKKCGSDKAEDIMEWCANNIRQQGNTMMWDDKIVLTKIVADELGIKKPTLDTRLRKHGPDCYLTYFPGRIPTHLLPKKSQPSHRNNNKGNAAWQTLKG